ncbi:pseudouridine synthase [bacterium]|nr:pseudouridine synthase [bacterium]
MPRPPRWSKSNRPRPGPPQGPGRGSFRKPSPTASSPKRYVLFNKPYGVLTRFTDPQGRPTLADFIDIPGIYPVGRLDFDSEGLLVLTDDGPLAHRLTDPRFDHPKTYLAQVERVPDESDLDRLRSGITLSDGVCKPAEVELLDSPPLLWERPVPIRFRKNVPTAWLRLTLREGRNRQVRRMTAAIGFPCLRLVREAIGPLDVSSLAPGAWRELTADERKSLQG